MQSNQCCISSRSKTAKIKFINDKHETHELAASLYI